MPFYGGRAGDLVPESRVHREATRRNPCEAELSVLSVRIPRCVRLRTSTLGIDGVAKQTPTTFPKAQCVRLRTSTSGGRLERSKQPQCDSSASVRTPALSDLGYTYTREAGYLTHSRAFKTEDRGTPLVPAPVGLGRPAGDLASLGA